MIGLRANETWLDIDPATVLTLNMVCPIFDRDAIERTWSYPFKLPTSPRNLKALGFPNRVDAVRIGTKVPATLYIAEQEDRTGTLVIQKSDDKTISVVLQNESLAVTETLRATDLRDIPMPVTVDAAFCPKLWLQATIPGVTSATKLVLQINDEVFETPINISAGTNMPQPIVDAINAIWPGIASIPAFGQGINEPSIYIDCAPPAAEFQINDLPALDDPDDYIVFTQVQYFYAQEIDRLNAAWDTYLATEPAEAAFPVVAAPNLYGDDKNTDYLGYANYVDPAGDHPAREEFETGTGWAHTVLPFPYLLPVLEKLATQAGLDAAGGAFVDLAEAAQLVLWSNRPLEETHYQREYIVGAPVLAVRRAYPGEWNVADHLPDVSAMDFVTAVCNTFALYMQVEDGELRFYPIRDLLRGAPEDWTPKAEPAAGIAYDPQDGYALDYDRQRDETTVPGQLERVTDAAGELKVTAPFFSLFTRSEQDPIETGTPRGWRVPYNYDEGESDYFDLTGSLTNRLLFYRGQQPDLQGNGYPFATNGRLNVQGDTVGDLSLSWSGTGGLYETWWQEFVRLMVHGRTATRLVRLTVADLLELRRWRNVRKYIYSEQGTAIGVVKRVKVKVSKNGIGVAEVEFQLEPN